MNAITPMSLMTASALASPLFLSCAFFQEHLPSVTLSDANIVSVLDRLDENEIAAARLAREKASTPEVQAFAGRVLNEHRELAQANGQLATQLSLQPQPPALASHLKEAHESSMRELRAMSGPAFDRAYIQYEIRQHVQAFNFLEAAAELEANGALKQELVRTGPDLLSHISAARALERHLGPEQPDTIALH